MTETLPPPSRTKQEQRKVEHDRHVRAGIRALLLKRVLKWSIGTLVVGGVLGYFIWFVANQPVPKEEDIISRNGLHWHPHLSIQIKGKEETIPPGIGLGVVHQPMHTHEADGIIHLEHQGFVTVGDTRLGKFFKSWGKRFDRNCIFDSCNGSDGTVKFRVNGQENSEFDQYAMKDKDQIEIVYE